MATAQMPSRASFALETTAGVPPANAAAWAAGGSSMRHIADSVNLDGLVAAMLEDQRSQLNITDDEPDIIGIAGGGNVEVPMDLYMHGSGQDPADGVAVTEDDVSTLFEHSWGGMSLGTSDNLVAAGAHTTTAIELTDTIPVGQWVGLDDASGIRHLRRVEATAAGGVGVIHTLHRALPFTPADSATATGCAVYYLDEDPLEDSSQGVYTMSWLFERGRGAQRRAWECRACKTSIGALSLGRNELAKISTSTRVGSFLTPESAPVPTWANTISGSAGSVVGIRTRVWLQDRGSTADTTVQVSSFDVNPGIQSIPIEVQTDGGDGDAMPGLFGYTLAKNPCTLSMSVVPHADGPLNDFTSRQEKSIQWERLAAGGQSWAVYMPRATYSGTPGLADISTIAGQSLPYKAHYDDNQTTALARSRIQLIRC